MGAHVMMAGLHSFDKEKKAEELNRVIMLLIEPKQDMMEQENSFIAFHTLVYGFSINNEHDRLLVILEDALLLHTAAVALVLKNGDLNPDAAAKSMVYAGRCVDVKMLERRRQRLAKMYDSWELSTSPLTQAYVQFWNGFRHGLAEVAKLFAHLDANSGVITMGLFFWQQQVLRYVGDLITADVLASIHRDRVKRAASNGVREDVDGEELSNQGIGAIKRYISSLVIIGELPTLAQDGEDEEMSRRRKWYRLGDEEEEEIPANEDDSEDEDLRKSSAKVCFAKRLCDVYSGFSVAPLREATGPLEVYRQYFERQFLRATVAFYQQECKKVLDHTNATEYIRAVHDKALMSELTIAVKYVHASTEEPLRQALGDALITMHADTLVALAPQFVREQSTDDLRRLYSLVCRMGDHVKTIQEHLRQQIFLAGTEALEQFAVHISDPRVSVDAAKADSSRFGAEETAERFVMAAWSVYSQYRSLVSDAFSSEKSFELALDQGCNRFINQVPGASEHLAVFSNMLLERSTRSLRMSTSERNEKFDQLTRLFRYVNNKQAFHVLYALALGRRLVNECSVSREAELAMIARIEGICGRESTSRLQKMFQDVDFSGVLRTFFNQAYLRSCPELGHIRFSALVLTASSWPSFGPNELLDQDDPRSNPSQGGALPRRAEPDGAPRCCLDALTDKFVTFYSTQRSKRRLTWLNDLATVELRANLGSRAYNITASYDAAVILLRFNEADEIRVAKDEQELAGQLVSLRLVSPGAAPGTLKLELDCQAKGDGLNLSQLRKSSEPQPSSGHLKFDRVNRAHEEDRSLEIQAELVRILKRCEKITHADLVQQTVKTLRSRFDPTVADVKLQIDGLIERDYMVRSRSRQDEYIYVA